MTPRTQDLLERLEIASHGERVREMMAIARTAPSDPEAAQTLRELAASANFYERSLALMSCYASRDSAAVVRFRDDPSRILRGYALTLIPLVCPNEQVIAILQAASPKTRLYLLRRLRQLGRADVIDAFLAALAQNGETDAAGRLLVFGSPGFVRNNLKHYAERFNETDWRRLARAHPDIAVDMLAARLSAQTESDPRLLTHLKAALPLLADTRPDAALDLARQILRFEPPARLPLQRLGERRPDAVADLALATEDPLPVDLGAVAARLSEERLLSLLGQRPELLRSLQHHLDRLRPESRANVFAVAGAGWQSNQGVIAERIVATMPQPLRESEARRHLALPALQLPNAARFVYASFLPWAEARGVLDAYIQNPDADLRAAALSALIGVARYHSDRLADVLTLVRSRGNEQDPVRGALLRSLAELPPSRWTAAHRESLGAILRAALDAPDLSPATASQAESLVVSLVPFHPDWAAPWLGTLVKERGRVSFSGLQDRLSDADVRHIAPALLPVLTSWTALERQHSLVAAARAFARRFEVLPGFGALLEEVAKTSKQSYTVSQILDILRRYQRERFRRLVPQLLTLDQSAITLPAVYNYLHEKRQDLLTPFLGQQAYSGRFSTGRTRFVLPLASGFERWTARQQSLFAQTLEQVSRDSARDTPTLARVIRQLAALPAVYPGRLLEMADGAGVMTAVRDIALQALVHLDSGQGVPVLVKSLNDDRARIAIYALRTVILDMPAERALALLQNAPMQKVTVAKEVVRLLGDLETPQALPELLEVAETPLHRDVRVALLRALWGHVESGAVWPLLNAAAEDRDAAVARGVVRIPTDRLSVATAARVRGLLARLLDHPDVQVRLDALSRCAELPIADTDRLLLQPLLARLTSSIAAETAAAAQAIFSTYGARDAAAVATAVGGILQDRRALTTALAALQTNLCLNRRLLQETTRAVLAVLEKDPLTARSRAVLAVAGTDGGELAGYFAAWARKGELHAEALMAAVEAFQTNRVGASVGLKGAEDALRMSGDSGLRRLAFACLVAQAKTAGGWTEERRARHADYCRDPSPLVAAAAQFTELPPRGD